MTSGSEERPVGFHERRARDPVIDARMIEDAIREALTLAGRQVAKDGGVPDGYCPHGTTFVVKGRAA